MPNKEAVKKDYFVIETDGDFFNSMRKMERENLEKLGDKEALAYLNELGKEAIREVTEEAKPKSKKP